MKKKLLATIATMLATVMVSVPVFAAGLGTASTSSTATLDASKTVAADKLGEVYGVEVNYTVDSLDANINAYALCLIGTDGTPLKANTSSFIAAMFESYGVATEGLDVAAGETGTLKHTQTTPMLSSSAASVSLTGNENIASSCSINSVTWLDKDGKDITKVAAGNDNTTDEKEQGTSTGTTDAATKPEATGTATGDNTILWIMMAGVVVAAGAGVAVYGKKKLAK